MRHIKQMIQLQLVNLMVKCSRVDHMQYVSVEFSTYVL